MPPRLILELLSPALAARCFSYLQEGFSPSTRRSYTAGQKKFWQFCAKFPSLVSQPFPLPTPEDTLMMFVSWLAQLLAPALVAVYLASMRSLHLEYGFDDPTVATPRRRRVLKGIRRSSSHVRSRRLPITKVILRSLHAQLSVVPSDVDATMCWATCCLAFFGFSRVSEFTTQGPFILSRHLSLADVAVSPGSPPAAIRLRLKFSKTDPFGTGCFVYLGRSGHDICPVSALLRYLSLWGDTAGPLFVWRDGSPLSPTQVNFYLRCSSLSAPLV